MNNKGFAITTILYGTMILFLMLVLSMLAILSTYKDRLELLIDGTNAARDIIMSTNEYVPPQGNNGNNGNSGNNGYTQTEYECYSYSENHVHVTYTSDYNEYNCANDCLYDTSTGTFPVNCEKEDYGIGDGREITSCSFSGRPQGSTLSIYGLICTLTQ
jgi:hypothetical protein